jgi:pimeloyl-ACP methyl ester carboxylesterase
LAPYVEAISTPADARGPVNWYRGAARGRRSLRKADPITAPTLIVWGAKDRFLSMSMIAPQALRRTMAYGNEPTVVLIEEAGHYVQSEAPQEVTTALLNWLGPA